MWFVFIGHRAPSNDGRDDLLVGVGADLGKAVARNAPDLLAMVTAPPPPPPPPVTTATPARVGPTDRDTVYGGYIARADLTSRSPNPLRFRKAELPAVGDRVGCGREADALRSATGQRTLRAIMDNVGFVVGPGMVAGAFVYSESCGGVDCSAEQKIGASLIGGLGVGIALFEIIYSPSRSDVTAAPRENLLSCIAGADRSLLDPR